MPAQINQASATVSATTTTARTAYPAPGLGAMNAVRVYNSGTVPVFIASGNSSVVATTASNFVAPGATNTFVKNVGDTNFAAITASGTATVYFAEEADF